MTMDIFGSVSVVFVGIVEGWKVKQSVFSGHVSFNDRRPRIGLQNNSGNRAAKKYAWAPRSDLGA